MEEIDKTVERAEQRTKRFNRGGWNLLILGMLSVLVAVTTTGISLAIYHNSGDIYLDRSRPGYLPDGDEIEDDDTDVEYKMEKSGKIDMKVLEEYLENLDIEVKAIDSYEKPFGSGALSNERLGIPTE